MYELYVVFLTVNFHLRDLHAKVTWALTTNQDVQARA